MLARIRRQHEHVARLHVAVDEAERVRRVERACDLADEIDGALGAERALALEHLAQVEPVDEAHGEVEHPVVLADGEGRHDVRLVERGRDLRLAQEPLAEARVLREVGEQHLERDLVALGVRGEVHGARRAAADQAGDAIAGNDASGLEDVRHCPAEPTRGGARYPGLLTRRSSATTACAASGIAAISRAMFSAAVR